MIELLIPFVWFLSQYAFSEATTPTTTETEKPIVYCPESGTAGWIGGSPTVEPTPPPTAVTILKNDHYAHYLKDGLMEKTQAGRGKNDWFFEHGYSEDYGFNLYPVNRDKWQPDCYLRYGPNSKPSQEVTLDFFNPAYNTLVMSHGWDAAFAWNPSHNTPDQWSKMTEKTDSTLFKDGNNGCAPPGGRNQNKHYADKYNDKEKYDFKVELPADCLPKDHDTEYWVDNGWNVLFTDWYEFAYETTDNPWTPPYEAESRLYQIKTKKKKGHKNVVELIAKELVEFLQLTKWAPAPAPTATNPTKLELRLAGNSLGGQLSMLLAHHLIKDDKFPQAQKELLQRIALLDPYWSGKTYVDSDGKLKDKKETKAMTNSAYSRDVLWPVINNHGAVIVYYATSRISMGGATGKRNVGLRGKALYVGTENDFYGSRGPTVKHTGSIPAYLHGMKWKDEKWNDIISQYRTDEKSRIASFEGVGIANCRVPTSTLKEWCGQTQTIKTCTTSTWVTQWYGKHVTWDFAGQYRIGSTYVFKKVTTAHTEYSAILDEEYVDAFKLKMALKRREKNAYDRGFERGMSLMKKYEDSQPL